MTETSAVAAPPTWLQGAWRRDGRAFGREPLEEISTVWWLQAGTYFADLRVPIGPPDRAASRLDVAQAFSGSVWHEGTTVRWCHDLDTLGRLAGYDDEAEVECRGATLIEHGPDYVELWRREAESAPTAVFERRTAPTGATTARMVMVADLFLAVWRGREPGGALLHHQHGGWAVEARVGAGPIPWAAVVGARSGDLPSGWQRVA